MQVLCQLQPTPQSETIGFLPEWSNCAHNLAVGLVAPLREMVPGRLPLHPFKEAFGNLEG